MGEIRKTTAIRTERLENEVVGCYDPAAVREVVGCYSRAGVRQEACPTSAEQAPRKRKKKGLWIGLTCLAVLAGVSLGVWFMNRGGTTPGGKPSVPPGDGGSNDGYDYVLPGGETFTGVKIPVWTAENVEVRLTPPGSKELTPQEVYERVNPAVLTVMVDIVGGGGSVGTGVIFTADGYVLTNYHVIQGGYNCVVALADNAQYAAHYVVGDPVNDVAVLKIQTEERLPFAPIGDPGALTVGDTVYAIGSPLGTELRNTFTNGIVSALDRDVDVDGRTKILLQTNAALNTGNSGGPLINVYGQVVGINTIKMSSDFSTVEGLGFAIPSDQVAQIVNDLLTQGFVSPQPLLGITLETLGTRLPDGTVGALVHSVSEASAAETAGLLAGDYIVAADGEPVRGSGDLLRIRSRFTVGDEMPLRIWRDGAYLDVILKLEQAAE